MTITYCCYGAYCEAGHSPECQTLKATNMTPTPHPADALPLPEDKIWQVMLDWRHYSKANGESEQLDTGAYADVVNEVARAKVAAHREGYELAMRKIDDLLSNMDRGVLRMPRELALDSQLAQEQPKRPDNFEFAMDFLGEPEASTLRTYIERLEQQQAGAAEVSDEQIRDAIRKPLDALLDHIYEYGTGSEGVMRLSIDIARAILALKATAGGAA